MTYPCLTETIQVVCQKQKTNKQKTNMNKNNNRAASMFRLQLCRCFMPVILLLFCLLISESTVFAATADLSKSYSSSSVIPGGSLVSLKFNTKNEVVLANSNSSDKLVGVAVDSDQSLLAVNKNSGNVMVSISGQTNAIVSTLNGDIKTGDLISESIISGVGTKAQAGDKVVGVAQQDFTFAGENQTKQIKSIQLGGKESQVAVGSIPILIALSTTNDKKEQTSLEKLAAGIAGKPVSMTRIILGGLITLIVMISLCVMIFSSIKSSITAVSRNPLAKISIFESLAQVMVMVVLVCLVGLATVYLVIRI